MAPDLVFPAASFLVLVQRADSAAAHAATAFCASSPSNVFTVHFFRSNCLTDKGQRNVV